MVLNNGIYIIAYMIIYSFAGWILESVYKTIYTKRPVNSGFLMGPLCPIYGIGAIIMYLFLNGFKDNVFLLFIVGMIVLSIWEYLAGLILEKLFKTKYWDYSANKFNFKGRICLKNSIIWGLLGVIFIRILHPITQDIIEKIPQDIIFYIEIIIVILIIIDIVISTVKITKINVGVDKLVEITENLKEKMDELKSLTGKANEKSRESVKLLIEELKQKQESIKNNISKKTQRLRLAFPSMRLEKLSKFLNKKIDILEILKNDKK